MFLIVLILAGCNPTKPIVIKPFPIVPIPIVPIDPLPINPLPIDSFPPIPIDTTHLINPNPKDSVVVVPKDTTPVIVVVPDIKEFTVVSDTINETITDLRSVLSSYNTGCKAISIQKVALAGRTGQAFYISANNTDVELRYTTENSLENAVYTYLDKLGIRWYGAGQSWLYKPTVLNKVIIAGQWIEPSFRNRIFAGTGGLETPIEVDPNRNYRNNWYTWKRRNRFSYDFGDAGHSGTAFYVANKTVLDENPQWFNSDQGKQAGRLRVDNDSAVNVYKKWALTRYIPNATFNNIGTDPEDGRGGSDDPLPADGFQGIAKWNNADKWWWLTNEVSKQFDENDNNVKVSAYAYGDGATNALVPKFILRKNVYPIIIPYAFQRAYLPNEMVKKWAASITGKMGIYDYWNITQWSLGLPQLNIYDIPTKLKFWRDNKIEGMNIETTDAGGPMGHAWWLGGQLEFDLTKNIDNLLNEYVKDCFGKGAEPMKNMYKRWSLNYQYNSDVNFSLKDLSNASNLVDINSDEWKRIIDLKAYVHFMKLMAQRTNIKSNNDSLYQYIFSINERMMVQTAAFTGQRYLGEVPAAITNHQLTDTEVEIQFKKDLSELPVEYSVSNFVFDYDKVIYTDSIPVDAWRFGIFSGGYFKANYTGIFSIDIGTRYSTTAKIFTDDSSYVHEDIDCKTNFDFTEQIVSDIWHEKNYKINVEEGKKYVIYATQGFARIRVRTPNIVFFTNPAPNDFDNSGYPIQYFYVPLGTIKIAYSDGEPQPMNGRGYIITPDGTALTRQSTSAANIYTVDVPKGMDGKVWKANFGHSGWFLINIPNIAALQPFKYTEQTIVR